VTSYQPFLTDVFRAAVQRCSAEATLPQCLPLDVPRGRTIVLGAGKAAAAMAAVAAARLGGTVTGCVVTRYGHRAAAGTGAIRVIEAAHPTPDANGHAAAAEIHALASEATADDRVIFLFSGGGSALLSLPCEGVELAEKRAITAHLVRSGAAIAEINLVRRHLSRIKGGRLAAAARAAQLFTFVISDVVGDDAGVVASGPSIAGSADPEGALQVLARTGYPVTAQLRAALQANAMVERIPHPVCVIASNDVALAAAAAAVRARGWDTVVLPALQGSARAVGRDHALWALERLARGGRHALVSGGELTVRVENPDGRGGPNLEYLAALACAVEGAPGIEALACDTDGIDGTEDNAGGYVSPTTLQRARALSLDAAALLARNETHALFAALGDLVVTGPTLTNVNDLRIVLVDGA
jgi:hydroxypyruvate reductase